MFGPTQDCIVFTDDRGTQSKVDPGTHVVTLRAAMDQKRNIINEEIRSQVLRLDHAQEVILIFN
jgi:hypothetical protein